MQLTSEQIARKTFVIRAQGYDRDEVEAFLRLVAEQTPTGVDDSAHTDAHVEAERIRTEAEAYARHVRESADAYALQIREGADAPPRPRFTEPSLRSEASLAEAPAAVVPAGAPVAQRSLNIPAPAALAATAASASIDLAAVAQVPSFEAPIEAPVASGLPSSGMAALDSLVDDVMSDVMAGFRSGSGTPLR